jgi:hypothetical protein
MLVERPEAPGEFGLAPARDVAGRPARYRRNAVGASDDGDAGAPAGIDADAWLMALGCAASAPDLVNNDDAAQNFGERVRPAGNFATWLTKFAARDNHVARRAAILALAATRPGADWRLPASVWRLGERQARVILRAAMGAGVRAAVLGRGSKIVKVHTAGLAGDLQRLALHAGWSADAIQLGDATGNRWRARHAKQVADSGAGSEADAVAVERQVDMLKMVVEANVPEWTVEVYDSDDKNRPLVGAALAVELREPYEGPVFCLTVPGDAFYVRRGGRPVWVGNSSLEFGGVRPVGEIDAERFDASPRPAADA